MGRSRLFSSQKLDIPASAVAENPGTAGRLRSLGHFITTEGLVKYEELIRDPQLLLHNLAVVQDYADLDPVDSSNDKSKNGAELSKRNLTFFCNAYNVWATYLTYKKMRKHSCRWKGLVTLKARAKFFVFTTIRVAGEDTNLRKLESRIVKQASDPRVLLAINYGCMGCPRLPQYLFDANKLDAQLHERAVLFVSHQGAAGCLAGDDALQLSPLFKWYKSSFQAAEGGLLGFINKYWEGDPLPGQPRIQWQEFDWSPNWDKNASAISTIKRLPSLPPAT